MQLTQLRTIETDFGPCEPVKPRQPHARSEAERRAYWMGYHFKVLDQAQGGLLDGFTIMHLDDSTPWPSRMSQETA
jgi:hypothetical protein